MNVLRSAIVPENQLSEAILETENFRLEWSKVNDQVGIDIDALNNESEQESLFLRISPTTSGTLKNRVQKVHSYCRLGTQREVPTIK